MEQAGMALTLSNRETFLVLDWIETDPQRVLTYRELARQFSEEDPSKAVEQLSAIIRADVHAAVRQLSKLTRGLAESGLRRVNFFELARAFILLTEGPSPVTPILIGANTDRGDERRDQEGNGTSV